MATLEATDSLDYEKLLELAENFSEDGVINFNFLRTLLVRIVEILKQHEVKKSRKMPPTAKLNYVTVATASINFDREHQVVSMHDSFSRIADSHHKNIQVKPIENASEAQTTLMQSTVGCQRDVGIMDKTTITNLPTKSTLTQSENLTSSSATTKSTLTQSENFNESTDQIVADSNQRNCLNDQFMSEIKMKFAELESNIHAIAAASNGIVNEMETIESTLKSGASEIKHVRHSLERLKEAFDENIQAKSGAKCNDVKAAKSDIKLSSISTQVSSMKLSDVDKGKWKMLIENS
jgi:hypothetical protein